VGAHPGLKTGLLFPSQPGTRPVSNDQLNDVWHEVQVMAGIDRPVTVHGIRHSFHDLARQQGVPDAVVKAIAGRAGRTSRRAARASTCTTAGA
jgi:site-specific recombinase XerD